PSTVFKTAAFDHSAISPWGANIVRFFFLQKPSQTLFHLITFGVLSVMLELHEILLLFGAGIFAGFINTMAGGGSLIPCL
ncbi:MAG: hypothetical protein ACPF99_04840, partial [Flavobacteriaceae bacterium]